MALERPVTLDPPGATPGGLLAAALTLPAGWERGITFTGDACLGPWTVGPCPAAVGLKPTSHGTTWTFQPFAVGAGIECSTMGAPDGVDATRVLNATVEWAVAHELATGEASARDADGTFVGNPSLIDNVTIDLGDADDVVAAVGCLEQVAAEAMYGRPVWLHTSPAVGVALDDAGIMRRDGLRWRTANGSTVILSPGYSNLGTVGNGGNASLGIVATAPVYAALGQRDVMTSIDRDTNTSESRAEDVALAAFDPCFVGLVGSGVAPCVVP